ncbi:MAG: tetratricopeptide repeat protein [Deltaproteobacteria bacterium]|nr:tetratricopeptide repeat protein [Deltaproteobacteria bacterium]
MVLPGNSSLAKVVLYLSLLLLFSPPPVVAQPRGALEEHLERGETLFSQSNWDGAIKELQAALRLAPGRIDARTNLGMAFYFKGDLRAAEPEFQTVLHTDPQRGDAAYGLGLVLYEKGDLDGAITAFRTAVNFNPLANYNLGNALEQSGDRNGALEAYKGYLAVASQAPETAALAEAVRTGTTPTPAAGTALDHFHRGQALLEKKDGTAAVTEFLIALRLKPNYVETCNGLGQAFHLKGDLDEAIAGYKMAIRLDARFATAHRNLAQAFEEKGDPQMAAQAYDRYLLLVPGAPDAAEVRNKIAQLRGTER